MGRGRKPTPTALKLLHGNPGKRALPKNEPKPAPAIPSCPAHLDAGARREWRRITKELALLGMLTRCDRAALAAYCVAWSRWIAAEKEIAKGGAVVLGSHDQPIRSPWVVVANDALRQIREFGSEFGLSPAARTRIRVDPKAARKSKAKGSLEEALSG